MVEDSDRQEKKKVRRIGRKERWEMEREEETGNETKREKEEVKAGGGGRKGRCNGGK